MLQGNPLRKRVLENLIDVRVSHIVLHLGGVCRKLTLERPKHAFVKLGVSDFRVGPLIENVKFLAGRFAPGLYGAEYNALSDGRKLFGVL